MSAGEARKLERPLRGAVRRGQRAHDRDARCDQARGRCLPASIQGVEALAGVSAQELRRRAWLEPEAAARRRHQRAESIAVVPRIAAGGGAEAFDARLELTKLQKTMPETEPGGLIVGLAHQGAPKILGGRLVLAELAVRFGDAKQCVSGARGNIESARKRDFGFNAHSPRQQGVTELDG